MTGFKATVDVALDLKDLLDDSTSSHTSRHQKKQDLMYLFQLHPSMDTVRQEVFAEIVGMMLSRRRPGKITMDWNSSNRKGKGFFDYNQNAKGKTLASIFSIRPTISAQCINACRVERTIRHSTC